MTWFGAFEDDLLVARLIDREYDSFFGGVPCRLAGSPLRSPPNTADKAYLRHSLTASSGARSTAGALISTLFPSAPRIYRKFGYEAIADYVTVEVPSTVLAAVPRPTTMRTRRATGRFRQHQRRLRLLGTPAEWPTSTRCFIRRDGRGLHRQLHRGDRGRRRSWHDMRIRLLEPRAGLRRGRQHQGCRSTGNRCRRLSGASFGDRQFREHHCIGQDRHIWR